MVRRFRDPVQVKVQVTVRAGEVPAGVPGQVRTDASGEVPGEASADVLGDVPADVLGDVPADVLGDVPADVLGDVPADVPAAVPVKLHSGVVPTAFIWRGRLYVVREVLAHWRERRAWWRDALDAPEEQVRPGRTLAAAASEQHIWRVEASPGWSFAPGVYDLAHDESDGHDPSDRWSLVRVAD